MLAYKFIKKTDNADIVFNSWDTEEVVGSDDFPMNKYLSESIKDLLNKGFTEENIVQFISTSLSNRIIDQIPYCELRDKYFTDLRNDIYYYAEQFKTQQKLVKSTNLDKEYFKTVEELDAACEIKSIDPDAYLEMARLNGCKNVCAIAATGKGKSMQLAKWLANSNDRLQSGIILTHCYKAAVDLYNQTIILNKKKQDSIKVFFSESDQYYEFKRNPKLFDSYNWIICYNQRLLSSDVDVLFTLMKKLDKYSLMSDLHRTYIISDEALTANKKDRINRSCINKLDQYTVNKGIFTKFINNPKDYEALEAVTGIFAGLEAKINSISDPSELSERELAILSEFTNSTIINTNMFQLKVYLSRFKTFIKYIQSYNIEFLSKLDNLNQDTFRYKLGLRDFNTSHPIIIFDATGDIYVNKESKLFYPITLCPSTQNIYDFSVIDIPMPKSRNSPTKEFKNMFDWMKTNKFKFKDNSIILWYASSWYSSKDEPIDILKELNNYVLESGSKGCQVVFYNGADILGNNSFRFTENVYILDDYNSFAFDGLDDINRNYDTRIDYEDKMVRDIKQTIGRTKGRSIKSCDAIKYIDKEAPIHIYFTNKISSSVINRLYVDYGCDKSRLLVEGDKYHNCNKEVIKNYWINFAVFRYKLSNSMRLTKGGYNYLSYLYDNRVITYSDIKQKFNIKDLSKLSKYIDILNEINIKIIIHKERKIN